jgi:hypothetical protein
MKPGDFFVGAMDFFAILMPGALLAFLLSPWAPEVFGPLLPALENDAAGWVAFAVSAYLFGHLLHHLGSFLDRSYDDIYVADKRKFGDERLLVEARKLTQADLGSDIDNINIFHWAGSFVRANNSAAGAEIERAGGESKFFRSLCLVALLAAVIFLSKGSSLAALLAAALAGFSYRRFCKQRWESSQRTYEYFVLLRRQGILKASEGDTETITHNPDGTRSRGRPTPVSSAPADRS